MTLIGYRKGGIQVSQITFEENYRQVYRDLYRFALYTLGNPQDAEDVVSDAVVDAYQSYGKLRNQEAFRAWIFKILTAKCKRKLKEYVNKTVELEESGLAQEDREWTVEESQDVRDAFFTLSEEERLIISMSVFGGYNSKEIGKSLLIRDTTVRSKLSRAFDKMQKVLEGQKGGAYEAG
ncbi:MAG: RNA polymerase sigma factor [Hungatella hathewayi]|nr:RNA polymerase sigma factor [Hungatella hathewayi]